MLLAWAGYFSGFDGSFMFESGAPYPAEVPYVQMRLVCALFGAGLVPVMYALLLAANCTTHASMVGAVMVLLDTSLIAITRYILLDPPLLFYTLLSVFCYVMFRRVSWQYVQSRSSSSLARIVLGPSRWTGGYGYR